MYAISIDNTISSFCGYFSCRVLDVHFIEYLFYGGTVGIFFSSSRLLQSASFMKHEIRVFAMNEIVLGVSWHSDIDWYICS